MRVPDFGAVSRTMAERVANERDGQGVGGLVWAVSVGGEATYGSAGRLDHDRTPMNNDAIFRIASLTKPIAAVAVLQLVESGAIGLDDAVDSWLPELANRRVLVDPTGPLDGPTAPADRSLTLRDLLTSRCGLGMDFAFDAPQPVLDRLWEIEIGPGPTPPNASPDRFMELLGELPLSDQPGTRVRYHTSIDIVSVLIERVTNEGLDSVLARRVFEPLGMANTAFWVPPDKLPRFGVTRRTTDDGSVEVWDHPDGRWSQPPQFRSGAAGLVSTASDLLAFGQMMLGSGGAGSASVLSPALVAQMTTDQLTDDQARDARLGSEEGQLGWGFGIGVYRRPGPLGWPPTGSSTWDGGTGARFLIVPEHDLCAVLLTTDDFSCPAVAPLLDEFVALVGDAVRGGP